jgi:serine phosphatase RsbU (regulator of sigma subunit)
VVEIDVARDGVGADGPNSAGSGSRSDGRSAVVSKRRPGPHRASIVVLAVGLAVTAVLAITARTLQDNNESRLLHQRVSEAAAVLSASIPTLQTPLSSGAVLAEADHADRVAFTSLMASLTKGSPFVSASVWPAHARDPRPLVVVGANPDLAGRPEPEIRTFLEQTTGKSVVSVLDLLGASPRRLGYAFAVGRGAKYVVYAEAALPQNRRANVDSNVAFSDLDYAIYLGSTENPGRLLASSVVDPRFRGRTDRDDVPFGDQTLRIVMTPRRALGGSLLARLPWLIAGLGTAIALAATLMTERLVRRRAHAEQLALQNARLFSEQRSVAQTLQRCLLPEERPQFPGLDLAVRYVPGVDGVDIGGDWYDVIGIDDRQVMVIVGDVSGRGLRAATAMASLRYAMRAYVAQGDPPAQILAKLSKLINVVRDGHFATVLCGLVDVAEHTVTFANAGHPNPLLIDGDGAAFVNTKVGPPVGIEEASYEAVTAAVPPRATLLAYTDGLYERRGESPDVGLARLRRAAVGNGSLDELLDGMLEVLTPAGCDDDTAILAVRWLT